MKTIIKNGRIIDPTNDIDEILDLVIADGKISDLGKDLKLREAEIINAEGKIVCPGLIDLHAHLRDPGFEYKETIETASRAAVAGGFTSVVCMPNTNPVIDNKTVVEYIRSKAKKANLINLFIAGALTKNGEGKDLSPIGELYEAGVVALSDDGFPIQDSQLMRRGMEYSKMFELPIIAHCEDKSLTRDGVMNEGYVSTALGLRGMPKVAEDIMVARNLLLADCIGCRLHITHLSTACSVDLIRLAKSKGIKVTADVCPHHLILTEEAVEDYDTNAKINPPLRTPEDVEALKEGIKDGTIDVISTDHAPHSLEDKGQEFDLAPFGIVGLETTLSLILTEIVDKGILTLGQAIAKMTVNPARILNLNRGTLSVGAEADITIFDPELEWTVDATKFHSKSQNTPFNGWKIKGKPVTTIVGGRIVMKDGEFKE